MWRRAWAPPPAWLRCARWLSVPAALKLRPYQEKAIDALRDFLAAKKGHPLAVLPPGTGKSLIVAELIRSTRLANPTARILVLTTSQELVSQNVAELERWYPEEDDVGVYSAGLGRRDASSMVLFGTIQTLYNKIGELVPPPAPDLLIIDEAHLVPRRGDSMYGRFISDCLAANEECQIVGLTATPFRMDSGQLVETFRDEDSLWAQVAFEYTFEAAVRDGFLCPLVSYEATNKLDVRELRRKDNDFDVVELRELVKAHDTSEAVVELIARGRSRARWLVFCSGVDHTNDVTEQLQRAGVACKAVLGDTPKPERDDAIREFSTGNLRALVNNNILTTGFNMPHIDLVALLRPTLSAGLYLQMVGRGARLADGKTDCLVLDYGGNIRRHGLLEDLRPKTPAAMHADGNAPVKACGSCGAMNHATRLKCTNCGQPFPPRPPRELKLDDYCLTLDQFSVKDLSFLRNHKLGNRPTLMVVYNCVNARGKKQVYREWVCVEHRGEDNKDKFALQKARDWWKARGGGELPATVDAALKQAPMLRKPSIVKVVSGQFAQITPLDFLS
jgi:DNA repair protein RadD